MLWVIVAFFVGLFSGFVLCVLGELQIEKKTAESGIIKLDGKLYTLEEVFDK
mgnify:CR=1 FL=1|jgi:hypothetical protein